MAIQGMANVISGVDLKPVRRAWAAPTFVGVEGLFFMGKSLPLSCRNMAPGKPSASVVGTPGVHDDYCDFSGANFLLTKTGDFPSTTYIIVARTLDTLASFANEPIYIGTSGAPNQGSNIYQPDACRVNGYFNVDGVASSVTVDNNQDVGPTNWACMIGYVSPTLLAIYDMTGDDAQTAVPSGTTRITTNSPIGIGGNVNSARTGTSQIAFAGILSRAMTDANERADWYARLKLAFAGTGIVF